MQIRFIRWPQACARTGLSASTLVDRINSGLFVSPVSLGRRTTGFAEHEVDMLTAARLAGQDDEEISALVRKLEAQRSEHWTQLELELELEEEAETGASP